MLPASFSGFRLRLLSDTIGSSGNSKGSRDPRSEHGETAHARLGGLFGECTSYEALGEGFNRLTLLREPGPSSAGAPF